MPRDVIRAGAACALAVLTGCSGPPIAGALAPVVQGAGEDSPPPIVEVVSSGPYAGLGSDAYARQHYTDVRATISGSFTRPWDGSSGTYKVPLRLIYPDVCAPAAVVETMHPNYIGAPVEDWAELHIPGQSDPDFDPLFDLAFNEAFSNIGARGLFGRPPEGHHVYAGVLTENFVYFEGFLAALDHVAAQPANQALGLHLDRPTDYAFVFAGVSRWLREDHRGDLGAISGPCAVDDVVVFGYSHTAHLARSFLSAGLNTELAQDGGLVFDGSLLGGDFGAPCYDLRDAASVPPAMLPCEGATPADQGPVINVRSDTDFEVMDAHLLLGGDGDDHYVVHHIAGAAHVDVNELSYDALAAYFGTDVPNRQNILDRGIVMRADLRNLLRWVGRGVAPPPSTTNDGYYAPGAPLRLGIVALDRVTGNTTGGVQLPALAAPLGLYRGTECHGVRDGDVANPYHWAHRPTGSGDLQSLQGNYLRERTSRGGLTCFENPSDHDPFGYGIIAGSFVPYTAIPGSTHCAELYPTRDVYTARVTRAAVELARAGFVLDDEVSVVIAAAEALTGQYPGCVPDR